LAPSDKEMGSPLALCSAKGTLMAKTAVSTGGIFSPNGTATAADRVTAGKAWRKKVPRSSHAGWHVPSRRPDPLAILEASNLGRVPELIPIRYGRMLASPLAFLRGSAAIMASDLAATPIIGNKVQACGDCHLMNFGLFATPERNIIFDINDFDETLPAPWEWDVKRLATSIVLAGRHIAGSEKACAGATLAAMSAYRERMAAYARLTQLDVWYSRVDASMIEKLLRRADDREMRAIIKKARSNTQAHALPKITRVRHGKRRIVDNPPLVFHGDEGAVRKTFREHAQRYIQTLRADVRVLIDRYQFVDAALKVVGVGSVGTRCGIVLLMAADDDPLFLQFKEAIPSVLEPYTAKSQFENHAQRVVTGQRIMQAASDVFLGWFQSLDGRDYYVRQLRDMKASAEITGMTMGSLAEYAAICGVALARAHARSGDAALISGYLGNAARFDRAVSDFARRYADQTQRDYDKLVAAVKSGRIKAKVE
jgi:uncharacterized protein (DUF2252 family)